MKEPQATLYILHGGLSRQQLADDSLMSNADSVRWWMALEVWRCIALLGDVSSIVWKARCGSTVFDATLWLHSAVPAAVADVMMFGLDTACSCDHSPHISPWRRAHG
jgi:hypothetical protein